MDGENCGGYQPSFAFVVRRLLGPPVPEALFATTTLARVTPIPPIRITKTEGSMGKSARERVNSRRMSTAGWQANSAASPQMS